MRNFAVALEVETHNLSIAPTLAIKRNNIINNILCWLCFVIAAVTYLLCIEPTASFWDCPEFILQAFKLEVGHPPGNPIFMLAARFFINFAGGDITKMAAAVNTMSALLSAGTILLLFWTITHLVKRLIVKDSADSVSLPKMLAIFGSGICGALVYTWSDTFWFSAVEGIQNVLEQDLESLIKSIVWRPKKKQIILYVDDIDRCATAKMLNVVNSLRLILENAEIQKRMIVICSIDANKLIKAYCSSNFVGNDYNVEQLKEA